MSYFLLIGLGSPNYWEIDLFLSIYLSAYLHMHISIYVQREKREKEERDTRREKDF